MREGGAIWLGVEAISAYYDAEGFYFSGTPAPGAPICQVQRVVILLLIITLLYPHPRQTPTLRANSEITDRDGRRGGGWVGLSPPTTL